MVMTRFILLNRNIKNDEAQNFSETWKPVTFKRPFSQINRDKKKNSCEVKLSWNPSQNMSD